MRTISEIFNDEGYIQIRNLLISAFQLKEKFDRNESIEIITSQFDLFQKDLEFLKMLIPSEIFTTGHLLRHVSWIARRIGENRPDLCYGDIIDICTNDIEVIEAHYVKSFSGIPFFINIFL